MKRLLLYLGVLLFGLSLFSSSASAQAPIITYTPATSALLVGVPFAVSPANTGGAVPATTYGQITTFAGSTAGTAGYTDATGTAARLNFSQNIGEDASGNLYLGDYNNNVVRKITQAGVVTTFAGSTAGTAGFTNATGTAALFNGPEGIAVDGSNNVYVGDFTNNVIRKITPAGVVSTFATGCNGPAGMCFDGAGNLLVAEQNGNQISKITSAGVRSVYAGTGTAGRANSANKLNATFSSPIDVQVDASGNVFVADYTNSEIREIATGGTGTVTDFAGSTTGATGRTNATGTAARFDNASGLAMDASGNFYVADYINNEIRLMTSGAVVTLLAGSAAGTGGNADGTLTAATLSNPVDLFVDASGNAYIVCAGGNNIRKMCLTGYTISAVLPAGLSFDGTTGIISGTPTAAFGSTPYTITAYNGSGKSTTTVTLSCTAPTVNSWRGTTNSIWTTTTNWSGGHAPLTTETVEIGVVAYTGNKAQPTISAATNTTIKSLVFGTNNTPSLTINSGFTLTVSNGMGVQAATTATINGPGIVSLAGASDVVSGGSLTATANAVITLAASSQLSNSGTFTLASLSTGSASISAVPATSTITGTFTVQRYITGGALKYRGYRLFSSPVTSDGTNYTIDFLKSSIYLTGTTLAAGGFDVNITPPTTSENPTLYLYRENLTNPSNATFTGSNFRGINNLTTTPAYGMDDATYPSINIPVGNGFLCFFRGNRASATFAAETSTIYSPVTVTMSETGSINYGNVAVSDWFTPGSTSLSYTSASPYAGFNLVGNPYPSSIDWDKLQSGGIVGTSVSNTMYTLDPVSHNFGAYISGHAGVGGTNNATNIVVSGQGFFIIATATGAQLTFTENAKTSTQNTGTSLLMGTPASVTASQYLRLRLAKDTTNTDETVINFNDNATTNYNPGLDAPYKSGYGVVSLAGISKDNVKVAIHSMPLPKQQGEILGLNVTANGTGIYTLTLKDIISVPRLYDVWLMDKYAKDSLDMRANPTYTFNMYSTDTASYGANRFTLMIRQNPAYAYQLLSFAASKVPDVKQVQINWNTANEGNYTNFTVEHSVDGGKTYSVLGSLDATGAGKYGLLDKNPAEGQNFYRLKQEDINNTITYSSVVTIQFSYASNNLVSSNLMLYPNPVVNLINLAVTSQTVDGASYNIRFMNSSGIVVKQVASPQSTWQGNVSNLEPGTYVIQVLDSKNDALVGQTKFVKM